MNRILALGLAALLCACTPLDSISGRRADAQLRLAGLTEVRLDPKTFDCVAEGPPAPASSLWRTPRDGFFFTAKRNGVPVKGAVCAGRTRSTTYSVDYRIIP